jgi:hypothetical protein
MLIVVLCMKNHNTTDQTNVCIWDGIQTRDPGVRKPKNCERHRNLYSVLWISYASQNKPIIYLNLINQFIFVVENFWLFYAARTECLNII